MAVVLAIVTTAMTILYVELQISNVTASHVSSTLRMCVCVYIYILLKQIIYYHTHIIWSNVVINTTGSYIQVKTSLFT